ncbi:MAG: SpoIIE family protein phosphatase [Candidatus Latescibacteria bacterium]|nr:SpoIIE family protein phosphatase [Candidatus Latescibacterota bacterium]NIM64519.1 SpoIIE family protein phosphatase [Candidatus Latescibacterota bacterium]NIO00672.1 SpoIIE family protein phosphatase [Candidatus Latescibacterota bacterium]NIO27075.1 SpoIIE family protein phosphatase [Candidatus Latescibacterota bacterium]NIO54599.1 SpoIIE family protein phosphatase [Candidatus Latescibacterota bacterium]
MKPKSSTNDKAYKKKLKELEFLISSSRLLNSTLHLDPLLRVIMKIVKNAINVEAVSILFWDSKSKELVFELARGRRDKNVRGLRISAGEGVVGWVAKNQKPLVVNNVKKDRRFSLDLEKRLGLKTHSIISIPLMREGTLIGVVEGVNHKGREPFTRDDLSILLALGDHICTAIDNARHHREADRRRLESELLNDVSVSLGQSISRDEVLKRILASLRKLIRFDAAAIFVVDRKKQELISVLHSGYSARMQERIKLKLDEGLVGWVAKHREGVIVGNCRADKRYINARARTCSEIIAPMLSRDEIIGIFNLESNRLDAYNDDDMRLLETFSAQAAVSIERAELYEEQRKKSELQKELRVARTVQEFFTPRRSRTFGAFRIAGASIPSLTVSGDYYDFFPLKEPYVAFAVADVAGKGVPASIIMSSFRSSLHTIAPYHTSARQIAVRANEILLETARPQDFVTAFIGVLDPRTGEITYCNAGHNPPVLMDKRGRHRFLIAGGPVLGIFEDIPLEVGRLKITDETLVCYTDGAVDARDHRDKEFGEKRLIRSIREFRAQPSMQLCTSIYGAIKNHIGETPLVDDVTLLVLKKA